MKVIYKAIIKRIREKVPQIKWVDLDLGQIEKQKPDVAFPCALISINITKTKPITDFTQYCDAVIEVRIAFDTNLRTSVDAPDTVRDYSLSIYDTIADVYAALQGYSTENFDSLNRVSQGKESSNNSTFKYKVVFTTEFEDNTAAL